MRGAKAVGGATSVDAARMRHASPTANSAAFFVTNPRRVGPRSVRWSSSETQVLHTQSMELGVAK
eukprot:2178888-Pyramimonas_sp.AAC.1